MRFLLNQAVYAAKGRFLEGLGQDVVLVAQIGLSRASDSALLNVAQESGRTLVTRDRDFGRLVFVNGLNAGVSYLRVLPSAQGAVHGELDRVLEKYAENCW